jgi:hypothetical protein
MVRVIDYMDKAEEGYYAVIALPETVKKTVKRGWFRKPEVIELDYKLVPVIYWAVMYMMQETEEGIARTNSVIAGVVRTGDSIDAAPLIDGYIGIITPQDSTIDDLPNARKAIQAWRQLKKQETDTVKIERSTLN